MTMAMSARLAGIVTLVGAALYGLADVLLLAYHIGPLQAIPPTAVDFAHSERWRRWPQLWRPW